MENITQIHENIQSKVKLYQVKNERMGGFVPSWDAPKEEGVESFGNMLSSYNPTDNSVKIVDSPNKTEEFGFLDIIDIINPLQHIPLVNMAYRAITGDQIKSSSQIIGGSIFGGPVGGAVSLIGAIIKQETGKDIIGNVKSFAGINNEYVIYENKDINSAQVAQGRTAGIA